MYIVQNEGFFITVVAGESSSISSVAEEDLHRTTADFIIVDPAQKMYRDIALDLVNGVDCYTQHMYSRG